MLHTYVTHVLSYYSIASMHKNMLLFAKVTDHAIVDLLPGSVNSRRVLTMCDDILQYQVLRLRRYASI